MLRAVQTTYREPVPVAALAGLTGHASLGREYPGLDRIAADLFEPAMHGDFDAEEFTALDAAAAWPHEPIFPDGTLLEIGFFGAVLSRIDEQPRHDWPERWFTRWEVLEAFRNGRNTSGETMPCT